MLRDIYLPLENVLILLYTGHLVCFINKRVPGLDMIKTAQWVQKPSGILEFLKTSNFTRCRQSTTNCGFWTWTHGLKTRRADLF